MKHINYKTQGTCSKMIEFDLDENNLIHNLKFIGGCPGNLNALSKLLEGVNARKAAELLKGNVCGPRPTSCADQLSIAIIEALNE